MFRKDAISYGNVPAGECPTSVYVAKGDIGL